MGTMPVKARNSLIPLFVLALGCGPSGADRLTVATNWPEEACEALERELASTSNPLRPRWIRVGKNEDPTRILDRPAAVDVVLGGPPSSYERLRVMGRLRPVEDHARLALLGRPPRGPERLREAGDRPAEWAAAYARLVREDTPDTLPLMSDTLPLMSLDGQGAALVAGTLHEEDGKAFLKILEGRPATNSSPGLLFLPDLLAATLVDARKEMLAARAALARAGNPTRSLELFTEAPPWPPASIARMHSRADGEALVATLAEQVAPDPSAREWLVTSWNRPPRPIEGAVLDALARVADGRLAAEPRFRAWLRSEWTAWARQRYRRVVQRLNDPRYPPP